MVKQGIRSIDELKKAAKNGDIKLTKQQIVGLKYLKDLSVPIPRSEITNAGKRMRNALNTTIKEMKKRGEIPVDVTANIEIVGSYRRGKYKSNDIDILIYINDDDTDISKKVLNCFVDTLVKRKIVIDCITDGVVSTKFMGIVKTAKRGRHIDIRSVTNKQYPFALLYFTGSRGNNIRMRTEAAKKGYKLNEYALIRKRDNKKISLSTEQEIYEYLGMPYLLPRDR